jgi:DNA-directed RNA polymerase subunit beta'
MRTFHTGGVAGKDITSGLPRVEELFEARVPKGRSRLAEIDGEVIVFDRGELVGEYKAPDDSPQVLVPPATTAPVVRVINRVPFTDQYMIPDTHKLAVKKGQRVNAGEPIAVPKATKAKAAPKKTAKKAAATDEPEEQVAEVEAAPELMNLLARVSGAVRLADDGIEIDSAEVEIRDHVVDATDQRLLRTGDHAASGQKLTSGVKDPHDILRIEGVESTQRYLMEQVQTVYRNQGVSINDKHIETIIRQMLKWVRVETTGDTDLLPNQLIDRLQFQNVNAKYMAEGGEPATSKPEILGVTRASLNTDSFLAKASFQETTRVLTEAAIVGDVDHLRGLKENVIIGRLIPARLDLSEEGRELLGLAELQPPAEAEAEIGAGDELTSLMSDVPGSDASDEDGHDHSAPAVDHEGEDEDDDEGGDDEVEDEVVDDLVEEDIPAPEASTDTSASDSDENESATEPEDQDPDEASMAEAVEEAAKPEADDAAGTEDSD